MAVFSDFYDFIMPEVPLANPAFVDFQLRRVFREFFRRTTVWRHTQAISVDETTDNPIALVVPDGIATGVLSVVLDGSPRPLGVLPEERRPPAGATIPRGQVCGWYTIEPDQLYLYSRPAAAHTLQVELVANMESLEANKTVPDFVLEHHHDIIADGCIAKLYNMSGKPWSQPQAGNKREKDFVRGMLALRSSLRDGGQPNASRFVGPRFGR